MYTSLLNIKTWSSKGDKRLESTRFRGHSIHMSQIRPWKSTLFHNVVLREKLQISFHREIFDKKKVCQAYVFAKACLLWNPLSTNHVIKRFQLSWSSLVAAFCPFFRGSARYIPRYLVSFLGHKCWIYQRYCISWELLYISRIDKNNKNKTFMQPC